MEIKINVKKNGVLTGSCGWVGERLKSAEILIKDNCLFVKYANGLDKEGKPKNVIKPVCGIIDDADLASFARNTNNGKFWYAYAYDQDLGCGYKKYTLFDTVLTDAGSNLANDFIAKCLDAFREVWENDRDEEQ